MDHFVTDGYNNNNNNNVVVAIDRDKNSQFAARWAIHNLFNKNRDTNLILIHVRKQQSTYVACLFIFIYLFYYLKNNFTYDVSVMQT